MTALIPCSNRKNIHGNQPPTLRMPLEHAKSFHLTNLWKFLPYPSDREDSNEIEEGKSKIRPNLITYQVPDHQLM